MKILINLTYYDPHWTGLTQYARLLAEGLAMRNNKVTVLTTKHLVDLKSEDVINQVVVKRAKPTIKISRTLLSLELIVKIPGMVRQSEVVIGFMPLNEVLWLALWSRIWNKKLYLVHNGDLILPRGLVNRIIEMVFYTLSGWGVDMAEKVIVYTIDYARSSRLLAKKISKCVQILPPVEKLPIITKTYQQMKQKMPSDTEFVVGFAGRFVEEKGFDNLLKAIPLILNELPRTVFVFAGETRVEYENFWEKNADLVDRYKEHLVWLGLLDRQSMGSFYSLCNLFVLSSRSECFGLVQAEAMMVGVPVVATDIPGGRWLVRNTGAGELAERDNYQSLAAAVVKTLRNENKYKKFTRRVKDLFNMDVFLSSYEKLWK